MLDAQKAALVIGISLVIVILFNLGIYRLAKRRGEDSINQIKMITRVAKRARNPWEEDNARLEALSQTLAKLKESQNQEDQD